MVCLCVYCLDIFLINRNIFSVSFITFTLLQIVIILTRITLAKHQIGDKCGVGPQGFYRSHPTDCNQYLYCARGKLIPRTCPMGLHWSTEGKTCHRPHIAKCQRDGVVAHRKCTDVPRTRGRIPCFLPQ